MAVAGAVEVPHSFLAPQLVGLEEIMEGQVEEPVVQHQDQVQVVKEVRVL
jgi:hypothetical protein